MNLLLRRYSDDGSSTAGLLFDKEGMKFIAHTLEDEQRMVKVKGETRIPAKLYELKFREEETPLTLKHREKYGPWFKYHIEVMNVFDFKGIYIHAGNTDEHTDGCILLGNTATTVPGQLQILANSLAAVERFYRLVSPKLNEGGKVWLEIQD